MNTMAIDTNAPNVVKVNTQDKSIVTIIEQPTTVIISASNLDVAIEGTGAIIGGDLSVTNEIGDALLGTNYPSGTTIETIIKDILAPFWEPVVQSLAPTLTLNSEGFHFNVLTGCAIQSITATFNALKNLAPSTELRLYDRTGSQITVETVTEDWPNMSSNAYTLSVSPNYQLAFGLTPTVYNMRLSYQYYQDGIVANGLVTDYIDFNLYGNLPILAVVNTYATSNFSLVINSASSVLIKTVSLFNDVDNQELLVSCNDDCATDGNYVYLFVPSQLKLKQAAATTSGVGVADMTESWVSYLNTSVAIDGRVVTYNVYRSTQSGAYDSDNIIDFTLTTE